MSSRALPDLQLSWTGSDVVAWSWDGGVPSAFAPPSSSLYGAMLREWGWLPPGSWSTRVDVEAPGGTRDLPAIVLPALAVIGAGGEPRRNQALSASSRWVRGMVALARHITGHGHLRPLIATSGWRHRPGVDPVATPRHARTAGGAQLLRRRMPACGPGARWCGATRHHRPIRMSSPSSSTAGWSISPPA